MKGALSVLLSVLFALLWVQPASCQEEADAYLWLEDIEGEKALSWVKEKNEATLAVLKAQPLFEPTYQKALEILNSDQRIAYPSFRGEYIHNFWQDEKNERGLWRRTTLEEYFKPAPQWEVLLDIDKLSQEEGTPWVYKGTVRLYPDYMLHLVYLSRGGGDAAVVREFDTGTKQFVKDGFSLPETKGSVSWKDRDTIYVQTDFGPGSLTASGYPRVTKLWKRGTPLSEARTIFEGEPTDVEVGTSVINTPERQYDVIRRGITFYTSHTYVIEAGRPIKLEIPDDANFGGFFKNQLLVRLRSDWTINSRTYKQGSLISID
ncbi:MAG: S9 family peptidase [Planctomycetaceae bacterium]|nr:MAG: S9 family peptidase [Planctomycetaceae bacterium]